MQEKHILLARPNQLLAEKMGQFLIRNHYKAQTLTKMEQLPHIKPDGLDGIVISTNAVSEVKENYASVYGLVKKYFPDVPVAFIVSSDKDTMIQSIKQNLQLKGQDVTLLDVSKAAAGRAGPGKFVLVIHENELGQPISDEVTNHFFN